MKYLNFDEFSLVNLDACAHGAWLTITDYPALKHWNQPFRKTEMAEGC